MPKYGKPVWQHVFEAAKSLKSETFSPTDIIRKVHETNPEIPSVTIRSYVIARLQIIPSVDIGRLPASCMAFLNILEKGDSNLKTKPTQVAEKFRRDNCP